jgi:hypothetical protein
MRGPAWLTYSSYWPRKGTDLLSKIFWGCGVIGSTVARQIKKVRGETLEVGGKEG